MGKSIRVSGFRVRGKGEGRSRVSCNTKRSALVGLG